jgi:hypothetical protein
MNESVGDLAEFVTLTAPHPATGPPPPDVPWSGPYFEWWNAQKNADGSWTYEGGEAAFAHLGRALRAGEYDGLLGFSQGTILASLALAFLSAGSPGPGGGLAGITHPPRFALLYCGVFAKPPMCDVLGGAGGRDARRLAVPSLHVIGRGDPAAPLSRRLASAFVNPVVVEHPRGHVIPSLEGGDLATLRAFLEARRAGSSL